MEVRSRCNTLLYAIVKEIQYVAVTDSDELEQLAPLRAEYHDSERKVSLVFEFKEKYLRRLQETTKENGGKQFFAKKGSDIIGFVSSGYRDFSSGKRFIEELFVKPECAGQGIASKLIQSIIEYERKRGGKGVLVETEEENYPARSLYERKLHFQEAGRRITEGGTFIMYERDLSSTP